MPFADQPGGPGAPKKSLNPSQAVVGAMALFELNTREDELADMARRASLPYAPEDPEAADLLRREWYGFVHAGLVWALMGRATTSTVAGYLGTTAELLHRVAEYTPEEADAFVDTTLTGYLELFASGEQRQCPLRLLSRVVGEDFQETLSNDQIAFTSGMMAITLCNMLDTLDRYAFQAEGPESSLDATSQDRDSQGEQPHDEPFKE